MGELDTASAHTTDCPLCGEHDVFTHKCESVKKGAKSALVSEVTLDLFEGTTHEKSSEGSVVRELKKIVTCIKCGTEGNVSCRKMNGACAPGHCKLELDEHETDEYDVVPACEVPKWCTNCEITNLTVCDPV